MRKKPDRAESECFEDWESAKRGAIRRCQHKKRRAVRKHEEESPIGRNPNVLRIEEARSAEQSEVLHGSGEQYQNMRKKPDRAESECFED